MSASGTIRPLVVISIVEQVKTNPNYSDAPLPKSDKLLHYDATAGMRVR